MKKLLSILIAAFLVLGSFSFVSAKTDAEQPATRNGFGMNVANFNARIITTQDYVNGSVLGDYELTFINYWATWCGPCVSEMPHINQMYNHYKDTPEMDVNVLGAVSLTNGCTESGASSFLSSNGYTWTNVVPDDVLRAVFSTQPYIPQTLIVDSHGVVRDHIVGSFSNYNQLLAYIEMWLDVLRNHDGEECTVSYVNEVTGEVIREDVVEVGTVIPAGPDAPTIEGYTFAGWVYDDNILESGYEPYYYIAMGDTVVTAHYNIKRYLVRFYDSYNNTILSTQQVEHGSAATPPTPPNHEDVGLYFVGWDTDFSCITQITYIHSVYRPLGDVTGDNQITVQDALLIMRAAMNLIEFEDITFADANGNGTVDVGDAVIVLRTAMGIG